MKKTGKEVFIDLYYKTKLSDLCEIYNVSIPTIQRWAKEFGLSKKKSGRPPIMLD